MAELKHGFRLLATEEVPELRSVLHRWLHEASGAELLWMENDDKNKVFGAAFRTPPPNATGVPHILEHCVLSGSRKYKTKEPFMNLVQTSLATFLNAITYPDKTIYPVASRNDRDFANLMDVYLDAVFYPAIAEDERIFLQEGWRYELNSEEDELRYSGVVYNEMRGAYSSATEILYNESLRGLFPDTPYANDSGGDPYKIPELSYEAFKGFYAKLYHPSNARLFLYGDMDIDEKMAYLDREYLSAFEKKTIDSKIAEQKPFAAPVQKSMNYSLASDEDPTDRDQLVWAVGCNRFSDLKENYMLQVLSDALFGSQSAPVRLALQEEGLCQDLWTEELMYQQSGLMVALQNAPAEASGRYREVIEDCLRAEIKKGLDRDKLRASLNRIEYGLREGEGYTTKGILYFTKALDSWLYGGEPADQLRYEDVLKELKDSLNSDCWERFAEEKFLNNPHKFLLHLKAEPGLNEKRDRETAEQLARLKAQMSPEEREALIERTKAINRWQLAEDTPEAKATMPKLSLDDLDTKLPDPPCRAEQQGPDTLLRHPIFTTGICYGRISFPLLHLEPEEYFYAAILALLLGSVDTAKRDYKALDTALYLETGGVHFNTELTRSAEEKELIFRMSLSFKTLDEKGRRWPELLSEILQESLFDDDRRILEILKMERLSKKDAIADRGNEFAELRLRANYSEAARIRDEIYGIAYYQRLDKLAEHFEAEKEELKAMLRNVSAKIFSRGGVIISLIADDEAMEPFADAALKVLTALPEAEKVKKERPFEPTALCEGIKVSSNVQYVAAGYDYELLGEAFDGKMHILSTWLSRSYLHNQIRAKGGAYGAGLVLRMNGDLSCYSYRDPEVEKTLEAYRGMAAWMAEQALTQEDVDQLIIGSMNRMNPPLNPRALGNLAYRRYITGHTLAEAEKYLAEALAATPEGLMQYRSLLEEAIGRNLYCVVGSSSVLEKKAELFDRLIKI